MPSLIGTIIRTLWNALCAPLRPPSEEQEGKPPSHKPSRPPQHEPTYPGHYRPDYPLPQEHHKPQHQQQQEQPQPLKPHRKPLQPYDPNRPLPTDSPHYNSLRARAKEEGDAMARSFDGSQDAYRRGDGALAKQLSEEGKRHQAEMNRLNAEAARWVFRENNKDREPGEVDLHGLFVKEAVDFTEEAIRDARARGDEEVRLIVGKGLHSSNNVAKVKPAIEKLMYQNNLVAALDPDNSGVLVVRLDGRGTRGRERRVGADEITRGLQDKDRDCVIM